MGKALDILIQPCPPGDDRFQDWSQAATSAMTAPAGSPQRQTAIDELREMGFAVLEPNQPPDPPPGPGGPQPDNRPDDPNPTRRSLP